MAIAVQLAGSLVAILLVAWLARWMGLGGDARLRSREAAISIARLAVPGFKAQDIALDRAGIGALLRDDRDRVLLIKRHGSHFAARLLDSHEGTQLNRHFLTVSTGERLFGTVTLDLGPDAQVWASSLRRLGARP